MKPAPNIADKVVAWQRAHGRHDLPWQNTRDAYRIWLSEIMLQQTQVGTVIPFYERFLERFPHVQSLARAPLDRVLEVWSGLGYYSRARNLHAAAQTLAKAGGTFPATLGEMQALPGIGRSTAAAILVFAKGQRHAILDGNVKRVFARCFGIEGYPGDSTVQARLWSAADACLPEANIEAYTQGLMDLGAGICTRSRPQCNACPLGADCFARASGRIAEFPAPKPRKPLPQRRTCMLVLMHAGEVLLEKRPSTGIWGGLWSLPEVAAAGDVSAWCAQRYGANTATHTALPVIAHSFTHYKLDIEPFKVDLDRLSPHAAAPGVIWLPVSDALGAALPAPVRRILAAL